ncbi:GNAT family N-acetyltransferase [Actinoplanes sp. LDG1-06]|uniref:GNAT family N-acetyltransferase n=1 Tax=Paractinoplanes ovalisporus TaxID=2810368 RepID=A0ABS2A5L9_9ACTN|nr:GNAT family N-acetyltransferase [Actinoplanes ovalisporus]MBM2614584.1 GNAT family N-acetyltransferase [Actinoplanes ovalisporus]
MAQPILRTERLVMVPLADRHLELEVELDADPEVLRYLWGRARSREEVIASHAERMALSGKVDGLGYWMAFASNGGGPASDHPGTAPEHKTLVEPTSGAKTTAEPASGAEPSMKSASGAEPTMESASGAEPTMQSASGAEPMVESADGFVGLMMLPPAHGPDQPDDPAVAELGYRLARRFWRQGLASEASRALLRHAFDTVGQSRVIAQTMAVNAGSRGVMKAVGMRHVRTFFPEWDDPLPGTEEGEVEYEITLEMWRNRTRAGAV